MVIRDEMFNKILFQGRTQKFLTYRPISARTFGARKTPIQFRLKPERNCSIGLARPITIRQNPE